MMRLAEFAVVCSWFTALVAAPAPAAAQLVRQDSPAPAAAPSNVKEHPLGKQRVSQEIQITGQQTWSDTGIDVAPGEHIVISASGQLRYADAKEDNGPEGIPRGFKDLLRILPFNGAGRGALIGRIGEADIAQPFLIGARRNIVAPVGGRLAIGINQAADDTGKGTYTARIEVHAPDPGASYHAARPVSEIPGVDAKILAKLPRRVSDKDNNPGDMVNFLIIGSEDAMRKVFTAAGWVKVDTDARASVLHGILGSISKESYLTMPMSPLYLFGRSQDYGWAHAEPIKVVASRNHLRVWRAPFEIGGETLWVGAATHDIGFERDERNDGLTHKIDPNVDLERAYVEKTLTATGMVSEVAQALPVNAVQEARTATGGSFRSDGRILVLRLNERSGDISAQSSPIQ